MKKLTLAISAVAAAFGATSAKADVTVSGSGSAAYIATADSNSELNVGQFVSFGLSTTTAGGMTISGGMGLSTLSQLTLVKAYQVVKHLLSQLAAQQLLLVTLKLVTLQVLLAVL